MTVEISDERIITALAYNYNTSYDKAKHIMENGGYNNRQILESIEYYMRYAHGSIID